MEKYEWMNTYEKMLENDAVTFEETVGFVNKHKPDKLYAYRKFDKYWRKNMFEGCIHLAPASKFNDPFDCCPMYDLYNSKGDLGKAYRFFCEKRSIPKYDLAKKEIDVQIEKLKKRIQDEIKVSCFTEDCNSILMWSYYANNHKGFCVEYDTESWIFKKLLLPVIYKHERYDATKILERPNENLAMNPVIYKADCWKHEKEWRIFLDRHNPSFEKDDFIIKEYISGVYLGANVQENDNWETTLDEIKKWGKENDIPIYQMKLDDKKYEIKF